MAPFPAWLGQSLPLILPVEIAQQACMCSCLAIFTLEHGPWKLFSSVPCFQRYQGRNEEADSRSSVSSQAMTLCPPSQLTSRMNPFSGAATLSDPKKEEGTYESLAFKFSIFKTRFSHICRCSTHFKLLFFFPCYMVSCQWKEWLYLFEVPNVNCQVILYIELLG